VYRVLHFFKSQIILPILLRRQGSLTHTKALLPADEPLRLIRRGVPKPVRQVLESQGSHYNQYIIRIGSTGYAALASQDADAFSSGDLPS
jgi:hypothetical protein